MKIVPLPEVTTIIMGQSPPSISYNTRGEGLPFFQGKADFGDLHPTIRVFCTEPNKIAEVGDILISVRAPVGPTNIAPVKCCIGRGLAAIRNSENLEKLYLLYFLRFYEPKLVENGTGSTFDAISRSDLEAVQIPLPPLDEQKRIAAILSKADRLRRLRRYTRELSDGYLQSVFLEMFGDPVSNPRGWEIFYLFELSVKIDYGVTASAVARPIGPKFLRITDIQDGMVNWEAVPYCDISENEKKKFTIQTGDIVFARTGATNLWC